jgi:predicted ArsR family transcriptional regulator
MARRAGESGPRAIPCRAFLLYGGGEMVERRLESDSLLGNSRRRILRGLLHAERPLSVDRLTRLLGISRNAIYQHLTALERDGLVEKAATAPTGGRPSQTYRLTDAGRDTVPRHYGLFARMLIEQCRKRLGAKDFEAALRELGEALATQFAGRLAAADPARRMDEISRIMRELGYESNPVAEADAPGTEIQAHNCVFHDLAQAHREVCSLDIALISALAGHPVEHAECMLRGGHSCRFRLVGPQAAGGAPPSP